MQLVREVKLGLKNLLLHGMRSLLTMLGMVFGVGSVVAMLAVGEGASKDALEQILLLGSNNIIITSVKPADGGGANSRGTTFLSMYGLLFKDAERLEQGFDTITKTVPVRIFRKEARVGGQALEARVVGSTPEWFSLVSRPLLAGRILLAQDFDQGRNVVVLTETVARRLLVGKEAIGSWVRIGTNVFKVVGVVQAGTMRDSTVQGLDEQIDVYMPLSTLRQRFGDLVVRRSAGSRERELVELHQILVQVRDINEVEVTSRAIKAMLARFHQKNDYHLQVPLALLKQAEETKHRFNIVLGSIAAISLLVGGIGIMNIMLASVTERTREIGIRRAIGATRKQITSQFLIETVVLSTSGGGLGLVLGVALPWLISNMTGIPTVVTISSLVLSLGISMVVGIVFGLYPAMRAARLDPIHALRHE